MSLEFSGILTKEYCKLSEFNPIQCSKVKQINRNEGFTIYNNMPEIPYIERMYGNIGDMAWSLFV